jgi:hypothetical protein
MARFNPVVKLLFLPGIIHIFTKMKADIALWAYKFSICSKSE